MKVGGKERKDQRKRFPFLPPQSSRAVGLLTCVTIGCPRRISKTWPDLLLLFMCVDPDISFSFPILTAAAPQNQRPTSDSTQLVTNTRKDLASVFFFFFTWGERNPSTYLQVPPLSSDAAVSDLLLLVYEFLLLHLCLLSPREREAESPLCRISFVFACRNGLCKHPRGYGERAERGPI